ncbi:hypothetical protein D9M70_320760 [compost metagenome]
MRARGVELADPEQRGAQHAMAFGQLLGALRLQRQPEQPLAQRQRHLVLRAQLVEGPQAELRGKDVGRLPALFAQRQRAPVVGLDFLRRLPPRRHQRRSQSQQQRQFLARALGRIGLALEQLDGGAQVPDRLGLRRALQCLLAGAVQVFDRLGHVAAEAVVVGQLAAIVLEPALEQVLDRARRDFMQGAAAFGQQRIARDFLGQCVLEGVLDFRERRSFVDEIRSLQVGQQRMQFVVLQLGHPQHQALREFLADHRQRLQQFFLRQRQPVDTRGQHALDRGGDMEQRRRLLDAVAAGLAQQRAFLAQGLDHFLHEERVAFGLVEDQPLQRHQALVVAQQRGQQALRLRRPQRLQPQLRVMRPRFPAMAVLGPVVDQQHHARGGHMVDHHVEEGLGLAIEPLQVFKDQHQRLVDALAHQQPGNRVKGALAPDRRIHGRQRRTRFGGAEQVEQVGQVIFQRAVERQQPARHLLAAGAVAVLRGDLEVVLQQFDQRQVGESLAVRDRERFQRQAALLRAGLELMEQPRLADARFADHGNDAPAARLGVLQRLMQVLQFLLAPDEARQPAVRRHLQARAQRPQAHHLVHRQRFAHALDMRGAQRRELEIALGELVRGFADQDRCRGGNPFHARGNVDGVADRIVIGMQVILADRSHYHLAGMDADADLQRDALLQPDPVAVAMHRALHPQRGVQRAQGMVLVRDRRAEQRQDAVAEELGDIAFVVVDRLHHQCHDRVDQAARVFRVHVLRQRGRAGHVGEQGGDGLALAGGLAPGFHRGLFGQDALGEMGRGVVDGGGRRWPGRLGRKPRHRCRRGCIGQGNAAGPAELGRWRGFGATLRANAGKPCPTLLAEVGARKVREAAMRAAHFAS